MKVVMTNRFDRSIAQTYPVVLNCSVQTYEDLGCYPHWVLELPSEPGAPFPTATFNCEEWDIEISK